MVWFPALIPCTVYSKSTGKTKEGSVNCTEMGPLISSDTLALIERLVPSLVIVTFEMPSKGTGLQVDGETFFEGNCSNQRSNN